MVLLFVCIAVLLLKSPTDELTDEQRISKTDEKLNKRKSSRNYESSIKTDSPNDVKLSIVTLQSSEQINSSINSDFAELLASAQTVENPVNFDAEFDEKLSQMSSCSNEKKPALINRLCETYAPLYDFDRDYALISAKGSEIQLMLIKRMIDLTPTKVFDYVKSDAFNHKDKNAIIEYAVKEGLSRNSETYSGEISKLPLGPTRDKSIAVMIEWLISKKSNDEALAWIDQIVDPNIKKEASIILKFNEKPQY